MRLEPTSRLLVTCVKLQATDSSLMNYYPAIYDADGVLYIAPSPKFTASAALDYAEAIIENINDNRDHDLEELATWTTFSG